MVYFTEKNTTIVFISAQYLDKLSYIQNQLDGDDQFIIKRVDRDIEAGEVDQNGIIKLSNLLESYPNSRFLILCGGESVPYSNALKYLKVDASRICYCGEIPFNIVLGSNKFLVFQDYFRQSKKISDNKELAYLSLKKTSQILEENNIKWTIFFGTLLGLYRDLDLMDHDDDIDIVIIDMKIDQFADTLSKFNTDFKIIKIEENIISLIYKDSSFHIDLYFTNTLNNENKITFGGYDFEDSIIDLLSENENYFLRSYSATLSNKNFLKVRIPDNPVPFLEFLYGKTWRIPDLNFKNK